MALLTPRVRSFLVGPWRCGHPSENTEPQRESRVDAGRRPRAGMATFDVR